MQKEGEKQDESPGIKFSSALKALPVQNSLTGGWRGVEYKDSPSPMRDTLAEFIEKGSLSKEDELKLMHIFIEKAFEHTQMGITFENGEFRGQMWMIEMVESFFDFIKLLRARYAELVDDTFWGQYLEKIAAEAEKRLRQPVHGISFQLNIEECERAKAIIEEINDISPLSAISEYRNNFSERLNGIILRQVGEAYMEEKETDSLVKIAAKHSVKLPTPAEYFESKLSAEAESLADQIEILENKAEADDFGGAYHGVLEKMAKFRKEAEKGLIQIDKIGFGGEEKTILEIISHFDKRIENSRIANNQYRLAIKINAIENQIRDIDFSKFASTLKSMEFAIDHVAELSDSSAKVRFKNEIIQKIDTWIDSLFEQMRTARDLSGIISEQIAKLGALRDFAASKIK